MTAEEFRKHAHELVEWITDYLENKEKYPVKPRVKPGEIFSRLPDGAPQEPEPFEKIQKDFDEIIMPGMTHWEPQFFCILPRQQQSSLRPCRDAHRNPGSAVHDLGYLTCRG